jgi:hypothetical protein
MKSSYITLDDPRVTLSSSRVGRVYRLDGKEKSPEYPYTHTSCPNGFHLEPRMSSVFVPPKCFNLNPGDFASIVVEGIPLLGIVIEVADHHYDMELLIDGLDVYEGFYCLSAYLPSSDGLGRIHWMMLDGGKHEIMVRVSDQYNRMLDASGIQPSHACISGFLLLDEISFPPPQYHQWMYTQHPLPPDPRGRISSFSSGLVPAGETCFLMDLLGHGSLETLTFQVDQPLLLEIMDGGTAQEEYPHDFPSWIRRVPLGEKDQGALAGTMDIIALPAGAGMLVSMKKPLKFASRLIVRLQNPASQDISLGGLYLEGTYQCI